MAGGVAIIYFGGMFRAGAACVGLGFAIFALSEKSRGEKGGYRF